MCAWKTLLPAAFSFPSRFTVKINTSHIVEILFACTMYFLTCLKMNQGYRVFFKGKCQKPRESGLSSRVVKETKEGWSG